MAEDDIRASRIDDVATCPTSVSQCVQGRDIDKEVSAWLEAQLTRRSGIKSGKVAFLVDVRCSRR